jgi:hypothetical protein
MTRVYDEIIDFISSGTTPNGVASWKPSRRTKAQVARLIRAEKEQTLSADGRAELNHYLEMEHIMRLAKARAQERLANE